MNEQEPQRDGFAGRVNRRVRNSAIVILVLLGLFLVSTVSDTVGVIDAGWTRFTRPSLAEREQTLVQSLRSDFTIAHFDDVLGPALMRRRSENGAWVELANHRRPGYWVQVVTRPGSETVAGFAVTSCVAEFRPTFPLPGKWSVTLGRSTMAELRSFAGEVSYHVYASSAPTVYEMSFGPSHLANFKRFAWGWNGNCGKLPQEGANGLFTIGTVTGDLRKLPKRVLKAAPFIVLNTYAEWGPTEDAWPQTVPIGVDETTVRNVEIPDERFES